MSPKLLIDASTDIITADTDLYSVGNRLVHVAIELALLGQIDSARELVSIFYSVPLTTGTSDLRPIGWAWKYTAHWPDGAPQEEKEDTFYTTLREDDYESNWTRTYPDDAPRAFTEQALDALLATIRRDNADGSTGHESMDKGACLVKALDISLMLRPPASAAAETKAPASNDEEDAPPPPKKPRVLDSSEAGASMILLRVADLDHRSADLVKRIANRWGANSQLTYLAQAERLWPFYARGLLADALDIAPDGLHDSACAIVDAFRARLAHGPASPSAANPLASKSLREILEIGSMNTCHSPPAVDHWASGGYSVPDTLFRDPATPSEIAALEDRLGVTLPEDYKAFLSITNGFVAGEEDDSDYGIFNGYFPDPALHPAANVAWIAEEYIQRPFEFIQLNFDHDALVPAENRSPWDHHDTPFPVLDRVIGIGVQSSDQLWLVPPTTVAKTRMVYYNMLEKANEDLRKAILHGIEAFVGTPEQLDAMEWCCAVSTPGDLQLYSSFRKYLEKVVSMSGIDAMEDRAR